MSVDAGYVPVLCSIICSRCLLKVGIEMAFFLQRHSCKKRCTQGASANAMFVPDRCGKSGNKDTENALQELADVNFEAAKRRLLKGPHSHFLL